MIRKVVIPAAGLGTRFLPITKSLAKEMLPIIDKPNLQYLLEEAKTAGINEVILIVSKSKQEIKDYFSHNLDLEEKLLKLNKEDDYKLIYDIGEFIKVTFVFQKEPLGLGHAILCVKEAVDGEDFAIMLGDDLVASKNPAILQLIKEYERLDSSVIGVQKVAKEVTNRYGIVDIKEQINQRLIEAKGFVEKPKVEDAPSCYAMVGRYVFKNSIFTELENLKPGKGGEYQLTDAMASLLLKEKVYAYDFEGKRYDIGSKEGYLEAIVDFALERDDLKDKMIEILKTRL